MSGVVSSNPARVGYFLALSHFSCLPNPVAFTERSIVHGMEELTGTLRFIGVFLRLSEIPLEFLTKRLHT